MNLSIRPMAPAERDFSYTQSRQIMSQTGCIGHLRADFGTEGESFYSTWNPHCDELPTDECLSELGQVINALRTDEAYGGILASRGKLTAYCYKHPESSYGNDCEYGVRADTDQFAYLLRLNPNRGEYNLYAYCYVKAHLERHLERASQGIRFVTPENGDLFTIQNTDEIRITTSDGKTLDRTCRFIDETHFEIDYALNDQVFHICQFAELTQRAGSTVIPLRSSLPDKCFAVAPGTSEIVIIPKGALAWTPTEQHPAGVPAQEGADRLNEQLGVTKAQAAAMLAGVTQGWALPAADPASYDAQGNLRSPV